MTNTPELEIPFRRVEAADTLARRRLAEALGHAPRERLKEFEKHLPRNGET
jgi:hypothetical protein